MHIRARPPSLSSIGVIAVIPWLVFNIAPGAKDINTRYFPVSTFFLVMAVASAYALSTLWPLYRSIFQPPVIEQVDIPKNLNALQVCAVCVVCACVSHMYCLQRKTWMHE